MPAVSVIIPAYNAEEFLEECLESIRVQSLTDFEAIIVNDGSTDDTAEIARCIAEADRRFSVMTVPNGGVSRARNIGMDMARGDYVTFVDADDVIHPDAFKTMLEACRALKAEVCITGFKKFKGRVPKFRKVSSRIEVYGYEDAMEAALYQRRILNSPWGVLMKRSFLDGNRRFREGTRYEDLDAFYRFYEGSSRVLFLPFPFYYYRNNPNSFINNWNESRLDVLDVTDRMLEFFRQHYPSLIQAAQDRRYSAHYNMLLLMKKYRVANTEAIEKCRKVVREGRLQALRNPKVRLKNKIGALLFYFI